MHVTSEIGGPTRWPMQRDPSRAVPESPQRALYVARCRGYWPGLALSGLFENGSGLI